MSEFSPEGAVEDGGQQHAEFGVRSIAKPIERIYAGFDTVEVGDDPNLLGDIRDG
jgi:hypothetical protein